MISYRNHCNQRLVEWFTFNSFFTDWAPLYKHILYKSLCLTQMSKTISHYSTNVKLVAKNLFVYIPFLSFSSRSGLNFPVIIVSFMHFALASHYKAAYYAYIDFTVHSVSLQLLCCFFIFALMAKVVPAAHMDQIRKCLKKKILVPVDTIHTHPFYNVIADSTGIVLVRVVHLYSQPFCHACFLLSLASHQFSILCLASFHKQKPCACW